MQEFRDLRPGWTFVSECDKPLYKEEEHGFVLDDAQSWSEEQLDRHYQKFFTELYAMAFAKHWIGVKYTNVSWVSIYCT